MSRKSLPLLSCVALFLAGAALPAAAHAAARPATHTHPLVALHVRSATDGAAAGGTTTTSSNWSGYDDSTDGPFTTVTATWVQPAVKNAGAVFTDTAFWVGIDGDNSDTVEQIGTEGYSQGIVGYDAWYEMYPAAPVPIELSIHPGDVITAGVSESGAVFTLSLADTTTGASYQTLQAMSVPPLLASAEVIAEAPSDEYDDVVDLADFATMTFTDCAFDGQPISDFDWNRIDMASDYSDSLVDQALPLDASGTSFSVTTDVTPPRTVIAGDDGRWHRKPVTLHLHATDPGSGSGVAYSEYSLDDGATWTQGDSLTIAAPADHSADGVHKVAYRSVDQVGNVELKRFCSVRIDTSRPTPAAGGSVEVRRGDRASLSFRIDDPRPGSPTATATIRIVDSQGRLARRAVLRATVDRLHRYTFRCTLPKGRYCFTVTAIDAAGNRGTAAADGVLLVH
jgi:hypothetical protein